MAGDGTTSVTVLCGALLRKSLELLEKGVHPTVISDAFGRAAEKAVEVRGRALACSCCWEGGAGSRWKHVPADNGSTGGPAAGHRN